MQLILEAEGLVRTGCQSRESTDLLQNICFTASKDVDIFLPNKSFHSSTSLKFLRDVRAEAVSRQKEIFLVQVVMSL